MTTMLVLVQFAGQGVGLLWYRYNTPKEEQPKGWRMPLYPLPCILQVFLFLVIFFTSDSALLWDSDVPTLELSILFLAIGGAGFLLRAKQQEEWPFQREGHEATAKQDLRKAALEEAAATPSNQA